MRNEASNVAHTHDMNSPVEYRFRAVEVDRVVWSEGLVDDPFTGICELQFSKL
jgi:hypothetical protein